MALSPRWRAVLVTVHLVTALGLVGADLVLLALGVSGLRGADPATTYPAAHLVGLWVVAPLAVASGATGLLLGALTRWGLLRHRWVAVKLVVTTVLTVLVVAVLVPGLARITDALAGPVPAPVDHAAQVRNAVAPAVSLGFLLLNVWLGRFKPGSGRRTTGTGAVTGRGTAPRAAGLPT